MSCEPMTLREKIAENIELYLTMHVDIEHMSRRIDAGKIVLAKNQRDELADRILALMEEDKNKLENDLKEAWIISAGAISLKDKEIARYKLALEKIAIMLDDSEDKNDQIIFRIAESALQNEGGKNGHR